jgi:hypothetical protein
MNCRVLIPLIAFLLSACAPMDWTKPGASQNDFSRDKNNCLQQAEQRVSDIGNSLNVVSGTAVVTKEGVFNSCMSSLGWRQTSQQSTQPVTGIDQAAQLETALEQIIRENQEACKREEYKPLYLKSACKVADITVEQLADTSKISAAEKPLFAKLRPESPARMAKAVIAYRAYGGSQGIKGALVLDRTGSLYEKNAQDLYEGTITWGDYSKRRKEIQQFYLDEFEKTFKPR